MALIPIAKMETVALTSLRGLPLTLRPATFVSVSYGPPTRVETIDGVVNLVKETPEEICALLAKGGRKVMPGAPAYSKLKEAIDEGDLESFVSGDDGKDAWIEALKAVAYGRPRSKFLRLLGIYSEMLSPFSLVKAFSPNFGADKPSPLEAEMLAKGFLAEKPKISSRSA